MHVLLLLIIVHLSSAMLQLEVRGHSLTASDSNLARTHATCACSCMRILQRQLTPVCLTLRAW